MNYRKSEIPSDLDATETIKEQRQKLLGILRELGVDVTEITNNELDGLWREGYRTRQALENASRQDLVEAGLPRGIAGCIHPPQRYIWKQQDSKALDDRVLMYANIIIINDREQPPIECRMRALVDTGAGSELIISPHKAKQLKLVERSRGYVKGFEEGRVGMIQYAPVLVRLPGDDSSGDEHTFKEADLTICVKDVPLVEQEDLSNFAGFRQTQQLSPEGNLQLTPVKSPPKGHVATAILGIEGLRKLKVTVKPEHALLCPVEFGDEGLVV